MVRFDEMLDGIISTAKSAGKVAVQKTGELVEVGKLKYQSQSLSKDLDKAYMKLGAIVYEARMHGEDLEDVIQMAIDEITELSEALDQLEEDIAEVSERKTTVDVEEDENSDLFDDGITVPWEYPAEQPTANDILIDIDETDSDEKPPISIVKETPEEDESNVLAIELDNMADEIASKLEDQEDNSGY